MIQTLQLKEVNKNQLLKLGVVYLPGIFLLTYIIARAIILPITSDEAWTCRDFVKMSVFDIISYKDPIPNNHIVNTLLIKFTTELFGWNELIVRLPNVLGFVIYYLSIVGIVRKRISDTAFTLFGIVVLACNPYLLDFFSLARGYGLSIALMMASIYFMISYIDDRSKKTLTRGSVIAALAVYTNFTILNFYVAFSMLFIGIILLEYKTVAWKERINKIFTIVFVSVGLFAFSYVPITKMIATNQFVYWGVNGFYKDTVETVLTYSFYYGTNNYVIPVIILATILGVIFAYYLLLILPTFWNNKEIVLNKTYQIFPLLFLGTVAVNILQHKFAGTPYLTTRTALFFYPLFTLSIVGFAEYLYENNAWLHKVIVYGLIIIGTTHLFRTYNFYSCAEWWYDSDTKEILTYLEDQYQKDPQKKQIVLNTTWLFAPSFDFYITRRNLSWIKQGTFNAGINSEYDYYYATSEEYVPVEKNVKTVKSFGWNTRFLIKK